MNQNQETIDHLRGKIKDYQRKIDAFKITVDELLSENGHAPSVENHAPKTTKFKGTFKEWLEHVLQDDLPKTTRTLYEIGYKKGQTYTTFAGSVSLVLSEDKGNTFKRHEFKGAPNSHRYYIGLSPWFEGDELKKEYLDRIEENKGS